MKKEAKGKIHEKITAIPDASFPAYVIRGERKNLMVDAGLNLLGPCCMSSLQDIFGDPGQLDYLFLTHSHYDHLGSAHYLKQHIPGLAIGAHERVSYLLGKSSVLETLNRLSANHVKGQQYNTNGEDLTILPFDTDIVLKEGDEFDLGSLTCRVYEVPGHTKDSLAFYIPEIKALFPCEACGLLQGKARNKMQVEFLSSYQGYLDSLQRMIALQPEMICLGHACVLTGKDAIDFLSWSQVETHKYRRLIEEYLKAADGNVEKAIEEMAHSEYDVKGDILQNRVVYMINLTAQVKNIASLRSS